MREVCVVRTRLEEKDSVMDFEARLSVVAIVSRVDGPRQTRVQHVLNNPDLKDATVTVIFIFDRLCQLRDTA